MPQNNFDVVFVTGLVRNNTTRHVLETGLLINYTSFCKDITAENYEHNNEDLCTLATKHLEKLRDKYSF